VVVLRGKLARLAQTLSGGVKIPLAQRQNAPVGPTGRLALNYVRRFTQLAFRAHIVAHLQRR
jgi:hypothetical protein